MTRIQGVIGRHIFLFVTDKSMKMFISPFQITVLEAIKISDYSPEPPEALQEVLNYLVRKVSAQLMNTDLSPL